MSEFSISALEKLRRAWRWVALIILAILIKLSSLFPTVIETYYSESIYPVISKIQRFFLGWIPFSVGDIMYGFFIVVILLQLWRVLRALFRRKVDRRFVLRGARRVVYLVLVLYVFFYLLWGLNYSRRSIADQLGLKISRYSVTELDTLTQVLEERVNAYANLFKPQERDSFYKKRNLFHESYEAYRIAVRSYSFLGYRPKSIKPSLYSYLGNYFGFEGYYNPFSGEGQVNTTIPVFEQPFVACHEIGHQVGYGKENEANFAGFLACRVHPSSVFRYSVYFDMYNYAINELYRYDSAKARQYINSLHPQVKKDYEELRKFFRKYQNPIEPVITWIYGKYLQANNQPAGRRTYSEVIAFLIAFQKKFGNGSL